MDIYSYIESSDGYTKQMKEVADHCRSIGQTWSPFEMAVIIGRSNRSVAEKHTAWRDLINNYPDSQTPDHYKYGKPNFVSYDSYHKKLAEVIKYENWLEDMLKKNENGVAYKYMNPKSDYFDTDYSKDLYPTFDDAWIAAKQELQVNPSKSFISNEITIVKIYNKGLDCPTAIKTENLKARIGPSKSFRVHSYIDKLRARYDLEGNLLKVRMPPGVVKKQFPETNFIKDNYRLGDLFGGTIISGSDNISFFLVGGCFYVYIPNPLSDRGIFLTESERFLLYKIKRVLYEFNPLGDADLNSPDEYTKEAWSIFTLLISGGNKENINSFWTEYANKCRELPWYEETTSNPDFMKGSEEVTDRLIDLIRDYRIV